MQKKSISSQHWSKPAFLFIGETSPKLKIQNTKKKQFLGISLKKVPKKKNCQFLYMVQVKSQNYKMMFKSFYIGILFIAKFV
jgi:hypothetical protein